MKKFLLVAPKNRTIYNFRGDLLRAIQEHGYETIVTGPNQDNVDKIEALGCRFVEIPMNKNGVSVLGDLRYLWRLWRFMQTEKPDVVLGYTIKPVIYGSIAAWLAGVPKRNAMVTGAGYLFASKSLKASLLRKISFLLYKMVLGTASNVIFQNKDDEEEFVAYRLCKQRKCHVVNGSGVNMKRFIPSPYPNVPTFFMLGRMIYSKGVLDYLEAARMVKRKYPNSRFMLLGKIEAMQDGVKEEEVAPYVEAGIVEHFPETDQIVQYYAQTSVFVLPTAYREGTPRVILEAMASARPIITTNTPGCKETVIEGQNGFFVPVHDVKALATVMEYFIVHPERIAEMGARSLEICRKKYEVSIINRKMLEIMSV